MITKAIKRPYRWKTGRWLQKRKEVAEKLSYDVPRHKDPKGAAIAFIELLRIDREMRIREIQDTEMLGQQLENLIREIIYLLSKPYRCLFKVDK